MTPKQLTTLNMTALKLAAQAFMEHKDEPNFDNEEYGEKVFNAAMEMLYGPEWYANS